MGWCYKLDFDHGEQHTVMIRLNAPLWGPLFHLEDQGQTRTVAKEAEKLASSI